MQRKYEVNPLQGSILKNMIIFALPIMGATLLHMLFSAADTVVIGNFGHEGAISAIGVSAAVINLLVGGVASLGAGVTVAIGKLYGKNEKERITRLLHTLPLTAALLGSALSMAVILCADPVLRWMNCPSTIYTDAKDYFCIYFLGVPFSLVFTFLSNVVQAKGNSLTPLLFQIGASIVNICLNLLFVIVFDWNIIGVAVATVIAQTLSMAALIVFLMRQKDELRLSLNNLTLFQGTKEIFSIGVPSSLEGAALNLSGTIIAAAINSFDAAVIAGNTIATTIEGLMVVSFTGFANASVVFISQNYGNGSFKRVMQVYKTTLATVFLGAESLGVIIYLASAYLIRLFTSNTAEIQYAQIRMFYMCLFFGFCGVMNVISGCVRGLGEARLPLIISILCSVVFRITWIYTYAAQQGTIEAIYVSYPICWGLCVFLNILAFHKTYKHFMRKVIQNTDSITDTANSA